MGFLQLTQGVWHCFQNMNYWEILRENACILLTLQTEIHWKIRKSGNSTPQTLARICHRCVHLMTKLNPL